MSLRLVIRPEAEADITNASLWYDEREPGLGPEFIFEIGEAVRRVVQDPFLHLLLRRQPEVRRVLARRFPYRILFLVQDDAIVVFAVLHAAQHDRRWRDRL